MTEHVRPDTARALRGLKDFQRDTVEYVFRRMHLDAPPARRFLVADEVGLGKTLVAKGLIAKTIDHLWDDDPHKRIDIVYVCSNLGIARQNIDRLNLTGREEQSLPDRITLLPRTVRDLQSQNLNFIAFTPGTSFKLGSSHGRADERALLYWLVPDDWRSDDKGARAVLRGGSRRENFERLLDTLDHATLDRDIRRQFHAELDKERLGLREAGQTDTRTRFVTLAGQLSGRRSISDEERWESASIVGNLRMALASACIQALEPDLVILDEFQRFRDLLHGTDSASELAKRLFTWEDVRVLLLSATPYKMYTLADDAEGEDHFTDFVRTVEFLHHDAERTAKFRTDLDHFREQVFRYRPDDGNTVREARDAVQGSLRRVMVRTERLAVTPDRSGMLREVGPTLELDAGDLNGYLAVQRVARVVGHGDTTEYWKSAPYLLNFMDDYQLKTHFEEAAATGRSSELYDALADQAAVLLTRSDLEAYRRLDPANARLRALLADTVDTGAWRLFWLPPALPYYALVGPFADPAASGLTKRLLFSSWQVVPKVVSALLSYEAERRLFAIDDQGREGVNTAAEREKRARLLQFTLRQGRPARMSRLTLVYPSITLATRLDPLRIADELPHPDGSTALPTLTDVRREICSQVEVLIDGLPRSEDQGGEEDESWYWAAPILLDLQHYGAEAREWLARSGLASEWRRYSRPTVEGTALVDEDQPEAETAWGLHVEEAQKILSPETFILGRAPRDLVDVLALQALASPAVVALRALSRVTGDPAAASQPSLRSLAGQVAHGFLSLFNLPEVTESIRSGSTDIDEGYWRHVLEYGAGGCLQAVLDEYAHVLVEWRGVTGKDSFTIASRVAETMIDALTVRAAVVAADVITLDDSTRRVGVAAGPSDVFRFRTRFAVRYGAQGQEERRAVERQGELQAAFNSPFWPFVLCTTSVGQEGLDFHLYCHAVVHWNLPSNPVDLEQREGRVHRFKGHAVRKNIAQVYGSVARRSDSHADPWAAAFKAARETRDQAASDLVPYWVYLADNGARIERHVPALHLSRDSHRAEQLRKALAVYRMAFGQSRQEELVLFLLDRIGAADVERAASDIRIDLSPDPSEMRQESGEDLVPERARVSRQHLAPALPTGAQVLDIDATRALLDGFRQLGGRDSCPRGESARASRSDPWRADTLLDLLDRFRALRPDDGSALHEDVDRRLQRWQQLLDVFASLTPVEALGEPRVEPYRRLLDDFVRASISRS